MQQFRQHPQIHRSSCTGVVGRQDGRKDQEPETKQATVATAHAVASD